MKGIYIHIPFCIKKCNYCDFASYPQKLSSQDEYINALISQFKRFKGTKADTVYIGGGTPSVLSLDNISRLLFSIGDTFLLNDDTEFTIEVNPKTVDLKKAKLLKENGVNRVSIGAQSFIDSELLNLGRIHTSGDTVMTYEFLREAGFSNISLDLMYAICGQSMDSLAFSLDKAIELNPEHISCYGLKIEENTHFWTMRQNGIIKETDDDTFADMYDYIRDKLTRSGYSHYEISNFAKEGKESRHNLKYWQNEDYLGFGLASSSKVGNRRYTHTDDYDRYLSSYQLAEDYEMDLKEQMDEFVILSLRVIKTGVDKDKFKNLFNMHFDDVYASTLDRVKDYVINDKNTLRLRPEALLVSNSILCQFMSDK